MTRVAADVRESERALCQGGEVLPVVLSMLVIMLVCGAVVAYVAFPHRGEEMPITPWLGEAMDRANGAMPTLDEEDGETGHGLRAALREQETDARS